MFRKLFNSQTNNFTLAALLIFASTVFSAILGLIRDRLLAGTFGAGQTLDIYFAAFRLPDLLESILASGGISAAFLPIFFQEIRKGHEEALKFSNNLLNICFVFLLLLSFFLFIFCPFLIRIITPGFTVNMVAQTIVLTRIMLITPILFTLSYIFSGWLQYFDRFLAYSFAPILYNLGIISGIMFFVPVLGIKGLAWGVVLGAFLFLSIQVIAAKTAGYHYLKIFNLKNFRIKKTAQLMILPGLGTGLSQLNLIVITALASTLSFGSLTIFTFSRNIYSLPASMIGAPFAIAIFPILSKKWHMGLKKEFLDNFSLALKQVLFLTIPLSILMFLLRAQIVRIILGAGLWGWQETRLAAGSLGILSFSIFAYSIIPVFQKAFYSLQDTKTPTLLQVLACALSIISSIIFLFLLKFPNIFNRNLANLLKLRGIDNIQVIAFSLAFAISNFFQAIFLFLIFIRKIDLKGLRWFFSSLKNILIISFLMAGAVKIILVPLADIFPLTTFFGVLAQTIFAFLFAVLVYIFLAIILRMPEFYTLIDSILKK